MVLSGLDFFGIDGPSGTSAADEETCCVLWCPIGRMMKFFALGAALTVGSFGRIQPQISIWYFFFGNFFLA